MFTEGIIRIIFFVIIAIALIIILVRFTVGKKQSQKDSLTILRQRYDNGEITKEAYDEARRKRGKR